MKTQPQNAAGLGSWQQGGELCPYLYDHPLTSQPARGGEGPLPAVADTIGTVCPEPSCAQPVQLCAECGVSNRSLARYCRACRAPLRFEETVVRFQAGHEINFKQLIKGFRQVALPDLQGYDLSALETAWGYVFAAAPGWGMGVLANTHLQPLRWISRFEIGPEETITSFHALQHAELEPGVLALSAQQIYRIDALPDWRCRTLFHLTDPAWTIAGALLAGTSLILRARHPQSGWQRWLALDLVQEKIQALPFQQHGEVSETIALAEAGKLLYHTAHEIVQIDVQTGNEYRLPGPPCGLNINIRPQTYRRTGEVFMFGLDGALYRCDVAAGQAAPEAFGRGRHELVHMFVHAYDDHLYLLCRDNLVLIDYPSGAAIWNSQQHAKRLIHCGALPPRSWGNYLIFSLRHAGDTDERVALFSLSRRETPMLLHPSVAQAPAPVAGITTLIAARRRDRKKTGEPTTLLLFQL